MTVETTSDRTIGVIGGGISGLAAGWELTRCAPSGTRIVVLEASERVGGLLRPVDIGGALVDAGADAFLARRPEAIDLCEELSLTESLVAPSASSASVWARGALRSLPTGLVLGVPTKLGALAESGILDPKGLGRAALDLVLPGAADDSDPPEDHSVAELVTKRMGEDVTNFVTGPLVGGINAGRVEELSAQAAFPALAKAARRGGSLMQALRADTPTQTPTDSPVFLSPTTGMWTLPESLADAARSRGVEILTSQRVSSVEVVREPKDGWIVKTADSALLCDALIIATPAKIAAGLLRTIEPTLSQAVGSIRTASVALVTFLLDTGESTRLPAGSGFLVPQVDPSQTITACTFLSTKWAHLSRPGRLLLRASAGRSGDDRAIEMSDAEITMAVERDLANMIGPIGNVADVRVSRFEDSFPQYDVGHLTKVDSIEELSHAMKPALALAGSSFRGVGVPACISSGRRAARSVVGDLD